ncbi:haloacid dehalogenase [Burkholderia territorii]|uniref:type IV secretion system protein n=1 Tax=Burkholderia territorii TaxID=1503055 RepID=UPI0007539D4D|nr:type IV secretion system protein [Burkholderia territorii]KVL25463.1 haloacid dehalogenase [Burkholderia territorii]
MKKIHTMVAAAVVALSISVGAHAQGIPVLDAANVAQAIATVQQLQQQYTTMTTQLSALTGNRGLGLILNDPALRNFLPDQWQSIYDQVKNGQLSGISNLANTIAQQEGMTASTAGQQRLNDVLAANKAMAMQAYSSTLTRLQNIQNLMLQSNLTQDPAAKADLQNRWAAEVTQINNEKTRLDLMGRLGDIEEKLAQQAAHNDMQTRLNGDLN